MANSELKNYDPTFQRALLEAIKDIQEHRKVVRLEREIRKTRLDRLRNIFGLESSGAHLLLIRRHEHLIRPLENN